MVSHSSARSILCSSERPPWNSDIEKGIELRVGVSVFATFAVFVVFAVGDRVVDEDGIISKSDLCRFVAPVPVFRAPGVESMEDDALISV